MAEELNRLKRIKSLLQDTKLIDSHTISAVVAECDAVIFAQRSAVQQDMAVHVCQIKDAVCGDRSDLWCDKCPKTIAALQRALTQRPAALQPGASNEATTQTQGNSSGDVQVDQGRIRDADSRVGSTVPELTQRPAAQTEREAFEAWYAEEVNRQSGKPGWFTSKSVAELRDGYGYGEHRVALNNRWKGWQARASLPAPQQATPEPVGEPWAHLWQHDETGRTKIVMADEVWTASNRWHYVGPLVLGKTRPAPVEAEPVGEPAAWQERQTEYVSGAFGRWYNCTGPSPRAAMEDGYLSLTTGGITYQWRPLYTRPSPGVPEGFALVPVEPTPAMKSAGIEVEIYNEAADRIGVLTWHEVASIYRAMLAAAQAKGGV